MSKLFPLSWDDHILEHENWKYSFCYDVYLILKGQMHKILNKIFDIINWVMKKLN